MTCSSSLTKKKKKNLSNNFFTWENDPSKSKREKIDILDFIKTIMIYMYV